MENKVWHCEMCEKIATSEAQKRKEHWLELKGGILAGIEIWLDKPRKKNGGYMHHVGFRDRDYDFCSVACLIKALNSKESI